MAHNKHLWLFLSPQTIILLHQSCENWFYSQRKAMTLTPNALPPLKLKNLEMRNLGLRKHLFPVVRITTCRRAGVPPSNRPLISLLETITNFILSRNKIKSETQVLPEADVEVQYNKERWPPLQMLLNCLLPYIFTATQKTFPLPLHESTVGEGKILQHVVGGSSSDKLNGRNGQELWSLSILVQSSKSKHSLSSAIFSDVPLFEEKWLGENKERYHLEH